MGTRIGSTCLFLNDRCLVVDTTHNPLRINRVFWDNKGRCLNFYGAVLIRSSTVNNLSPTPVNALTPSSVNLEMMTKRTIVGNVACSRTVAQTILATGTHDRRLLRSVAGMPLVATSTPLTTVATADTTTPANPNTVVNTATQAVSLRLNSTNRVIKAAARRQMT